MRSSFKNARFLATYSLVGLLASNTLLAYEQGSLLIFDLLDASTSESAPSTRIGISKEIFAKAEKTTASPSATLQSASEFIVDFSSTNPSITGFGSTDPATEEAEETNFLGTKTSNAFGTATGSIFGE